MADRKLGSFYNEVGLNSMGRILSRVQKYSGKTIDLH